MKVAIMQPYLLPYIGYFQLINVVDQFVIYDNIEFTKKSWIKRNRFLSNGQAKYFSIPIKKDHDHLPVIERQLTPDAQGNLNKLVRQFEQAYHKAPYFLHVLPLLKDIFTIKNYNLFWFIFYSLTKTLSYLRITTPVVVSSTIDLADHSLRSEQKVISICQALGASDYINPIGGKLLYNHSDFNKAGIGLTFLKPHSIEYAQFGGDFLPWLSILDVMMFNSVEQIQQLLQQFTLEAAYYDQPT
ncbi:WbqC family protein [Zooshikella sp. RANM57]|uniref:WbqC family protein n=1 Tax=Zooshikella sp. RANM57 TaxID=3425863 RepID=UPI003D6F6A51